MNAKRRKLVRWSVVVLVLGLLAFGAAVVDRMALSYLTGARRVPGRDFYGDEVRQEGPVPGSALLGRSTTSEDPPGLRLIRVFDSGSEIGLRPGDVVTSVEGKLYLSGRELMRDLIREHLAGDTVSLTVRRPDEPERELRFTLKLEPFLRHPGDLGLPYEDVSITSKSGFTLRGWYIPAPDWSDGRAGVFVHGAWASRFQALEQGAKYWHRRGYGLLAMDLSGRGTSDGDYVTFTVNERKDIASMIDYLRARADVRPEAVVVFGTSNGAASAIYAASEYEQKSPLPALVLDSPYSDLFVAAGEMLRSRGGFPLLRYPLLVAVRLRAGIDLRQVRPIDVITRIRCPVLFIHGDADDLVPPYHSERMAKARLDAGLPTERWLLPGGDHGFDNYPPSGIFWNRILDFYDQALGGPPAQLSFLKGEEEEDEISPRGIEARPR